MSWIRSLALWKKNPSVVEDSNVVEKAQDVEIGAGLDDEEMEEVGKQSGVDSGAKKVKKMSVPPPSRWQISRHRRDG